MNEMAPTQIFDTSTQGDSEPHSPRLDKLLQRGCCLVAFLVPIKLSLTYIALIPLLCLVGYSWFHQRRHANVSAHIAPLIAPLAFFLLCVSVSAFTGVQPAHSIPALLSLLFFALTLPLFYRHSSARAVFGALVAGQTIAALHSTIDAIFPDTIPHLFVGKVTESGQLAVTIPLVMGMLVVALRELHSGHDYNSRRRSTLISAAWAACGVSVVTLAILSFRHALGTLAWVVVALSLAFALSVGGALSLARRHGAHVRSIAVLSAICLPLLLNALLVNLKRGPWLGVIVATVVFCSFFAKRLIGVVVAVSIVAAVSITPVRERIADSYDHFTISGGRSTIWRIGAELASEYPLGIGYHNSGILRQFAPEIPPELKHFHNNILNITAESGWLAGFIFMWFIYSVCRFCLQRNASPLVVAVGCAVLSWQTAGLVEYNFGDSEVTLLIWIALGLAMRMAEGERYSGVSKA